MRRKRLQFEGEEIEPLDIAGALHGWLRDDLSKHHIELSALRRAELAAKLSFSSINANARITRDHHMDRSGRPIDSGAFHRIEIECCSVVETDEAIHTSRYRMSKSFRTTGLPSNTRWSGRVKDKVPSSNADARAAQLNR